MPTLWGGNLMTRVAIIGAGVIGSAIAYELSCFLDLKITLIDERGPASGCTGAALGVLMGIISHKTKSRAWRLREQSIRRYQTLIPELEIITGDKIPFNRQGIVKLLFQGEHLLPWERLRASRLCQGWDLEIWDPARLRSKCPEIKNEKIIGAIYSPQDGQVNPTILTQTLIKAATIKGVNCKFGVKVENFASIDDGALQRCDRIYTSEGALETDWLIIAAGLGSNFLTASLSQQMDIRPVLGQALHLKLNHPLGNQNFQPVITGDDVHLVPLGKGEYWVGATVEFPSETGELVSQMELLDEVKRKAMAFCPNLAHAHIINTWSGKRPRPQAEAAPIIKLLAGYSNVLLATGHYRNGVLLAPATAREISCYPFTLPVETAAVRI
jgi:glycine/D-amino acid oxidase-like deaminating enzyme